MSQKEALEMLRRELEIGLDSISLRHRSGSLSNSWKAGYLTGYLGATILGIREGAASDAAFLREQLDAEIEHSSSLLGLLGQFREWLRATQAEVKKLKEERDGQPG